MKTNDAERGQWYLLVKINEMEGQRARPQEVRDFIDMIWKYLYGETLR